MFYILNEARQVVSATLEEWSDYYNTNDRHLCKTQVRDGAWVSTVFLGIDHGWGGGTPLVFESMAFTCEHEKHIAFGREVDGVGEELDQERYCTYDQALRGHERMVEKWAKAREDA